MPEEPQAETQAKVPEPLLARLRCSELAGPLPANAPDHPSRWSYT